MNEWSLIFDGFDPGKEGLREALCTLGNGYFATRGAAPEARAGEVHYPGTYLAGGYNRLGTPMGGRVIENEDLVNMPNWLALSFKVDDAWFDPQAVELLAYRQELDLRRGLLLRDLTFKDRHGRSTRVQQRRLVSMANPHLAALETTLTPLDWSGTAEVCSALDGRVSNGGVARYRSLSSEHLQPIESKAWGERCAYLKVQTTQSELRVAEGARTRVLRDGAEEAIERHTVHEPGYVGQRFCVDLERGQPVSIEKVVGLYTSRDRAISECGLAARIAVERSGGLDELLYHHTRAWEALWHRFDTTVEPAAPTANGRTQCILRLHIFHLLQTASLHNTEVDAGIPARGWHGEAYRGHIFWDELFIFPLLNMRIPEITRSLLLYRYWRLDEAREAAAALGHRGARFPWQSGSDGREETQQVHLNPRSGRWYPDNSRLQYHVNSAIAYNIWHYYQVTRDVEFLAFHGAEMILEIARFWASMATYNQAEDRYEILGVMGPDEYHEAYPGAERSGLNNNAYTNVMAVWVLMRALDVLELLSQRRCRELREDLGLEDAELRHWDEISRKMKVVFHGGGVISQFEGYETLREIDWEAYREKYGDIHRLDRILEAEGDSANHYKLSKQADVLMLFYLFSVEELSDVLARLGYTLDQDAIPRMIDYYLNRTSHGSTLSLVVHSWVLARRDRDHSWAFFRQALESDISDVQGGTTPEGIHLGAMAGTVDLVQRGYTGLDTRDDILWLSPSLPSELKSLRMNVTYRGHLLELVFTQTSVQIASRSPDLEPIRVGFQDQRFDLAGGEEKRLAL